MDGYRIVRIPAANPLERRLGVPWPLPGGRALVRVLRRELAAADVVHVQDVLYATSLAALLLARRTRTSAVLTQHVALVPQRGRVLDAVQRLAYRATVPAARLASARAAYNARVARWAQELWRAPVELLPAGVELPPGTATRRELGLPEHRLVALAVGRDAPKKRLDVLRAATDEAYELVLVTDASVEPRPGLHPRPFMPPSQLARLMRAADAFVLPSTGEGVPLSLQEAMHAGLPCVLAYDDGYEWAFSRDDVICVEAEAASIRSALLRLASDEELRLALAARSRAAAERSFGVEAFVTAYERLYASAARRPLG